MATFEEFKTEAEFQAAYNLMQQNVEIACSDIDCLIMKLPRDCIAIHGFAANAHDLRAAAQRMALCIPDVCRAIVKAHGLKVDPSEPMGSHTFAVAMPGKAAKPDMRVKANRPAKPRRKR